MQKAVRRRKQKNRQCRELSSRAKELKKSKTDLKKYRSIKPNIFTNRRGKR